MNQMIKCPNCGTEISVDSLLRHEIEESLKKDFQNRQKQQEEDFSQKQKEIEEKEKRLINLQKDTERQIQERLKVEKNKLTEVVKAEILKEKQDEFNLLKESLKEKETKLDEARKIELQLRKDREKLSEDKKAFELEKQRQLDEERKSIEDKAVKIAEEQQGLKVAELQKKLEDAVKLNLDLNRKLQQGSQQTQGEILELELENLLKTTFVYDEVVAIAKGVNGADILQKVRDQNGRDCGKIVWELKQTKAWDKNWIQKLKDDQIKIGADSAVIVSTILPSDIKHIGFKSGVVICDLFSAIGIAHVIRNKLQELSLVKVSMVGKKEKMEVIFNYLTSVEFRQKIESIVDAFTSMKNDLDNEKRAMQKIWSKRDKEIQRVLENTVGMYGDLQGLMGASLKEIKSLELPEPEI